MSAAARVGSEMRFQFAFLVVVVGRQLPTPIVARKTSTSVVAASRPCKPTIAVGKRCSAGSLAVDSGRVSAAAAPLGEPDSEHREADRGHDQQQHER
jgi:hypothetical protein